MTSAEHGPSPENIWPALAAWFARSQRDLPWRRVGASGARDGFAALVSEFMLQQTQVSRVLEKFGPFMKKFPDAASLARAPEDEVLAMWSGLGYYRRARLLHAAAKAIAERHDGQVPADAAALRALPGVGRYTAGAISSIVFGQPEAIVDGNVARVLQRLHGREGAIDEPPVRAWCWDRATRLAGSAGPQAGVVNEALMELGALVCTPRNPACDACPLAGMCRARSMDAVESIPRPKRAATRSPMWCASALIEDDLGRVLIERRASDAGMWAGLWQAPTIESVQRAVSRAALARRVGLGPSALRKIGAFEHATTHRDVRFVVYVGRVPAGYVPQPGLIFESRERIRGLGLSNPQARILLGPGPAVITSA